MLHAGSTAVKVLALPGGASTEFLTRCALEDIDYSACAQIANCPVCEGREFRRVGSVPTIHPDSKAEFAVNRCRACGHWHTTPLPSQGYLNALYSSGSLSVIGEGWAKDTQNRSVDARLLASPDDTSY